ncbi:hypothetical protein [Paenibacillus thermotolerans]|uniref:hypothetical protein n=1 Tax=Paenibacillus thermotolerans TaxID=3027807 RepID=UPI002367F465|nr:MULTISPECIES: hypothetical protein [unclassified Paenibacillus]
MERDGVVRVRVGQRVEIDQVGEGTVTEVAGSEIEVAVSEVETYRVSADQLVDADELMQ